MSRLGDIEAALVTQLEAAMLAGSPVFTTVRGASGGYRAAVRDALRREIMPAAWVAFVEEPTAPETVIEKRGARFVVLTAARALRQGTDPRNGDSGGLGAFTLLEQTRLALDGFAPSAGLESQALHEKFVTADERVAVYEVLYRIWPIPDPGLVPGAPGILTSSNEDPGGSLDLNWSEAAESGSVEPADYYRVFRKQNLETSFTLLDTAAKDATSKTLTGQPTGVNVWYYLTGGNSAGEGPQGNTIQVRL